MMDMKREKMKDIVLGLIAEGEFDLKSPRTDFMLVVRKLRGDEGSRKNLSSSEYNRLMQCFLGVVDEVSRKLGIKMEEDGSIRRIRDWKEFATPTIMRGARGAEIRHSRVLKYDD